MVTERQVRAWVEGFLRAWTTSGRRDIAALFAARVEYHEWPHRTGWLGRAPR